MKRYFIWIAATSLLVLSCKCASSTVSKMQRGMPESKPIVAVLPFSVENMREGQQLGAFIAEELSQALFIFNKAIIIDPGLARTEARKMGVSIKHPDASLYPCFNEKFNADFIIIGQICGMKDALIIDPADENAAYQIRFRIIASNGTTMRGVVARDFKGLKDKRKEILFGIKKMARRVRFHNWLKDSPDTEDIDI